jgi:hypothetical protein
MSGDLIAIQLFHCENLNRAPEVRGAFYRRRSSLAFVRLLEMISLPTYYRTPFRFPDSTAARGKSKVAQQPQGVVPRLKPLPQCSEKSNDLPFLLKAVQTYSGDAILYSTFLFVIMELQIRLPDPKNSDNQPDKVFRSSLAICEQLSAKVPPRNEPQLWALDM